MKKRSMPHFNLPNKKWNIVEDSLVYRIVKDKEDKIYKKIYSFDLDNTLILSRTYFKPAQNEHDYIFYSDNVIDFLKKKYSENYKIIIFSNQKGVSTGKISLLNIINRVDDVIEKIGIPLECYLALRNDKYRKPRIGMYNFAKQNNNNEIEEIIYVGDNANRTYDDNFKRLYINHLKYIYAKNNVKVDIDEIYKKLKKDYTDTDLKFALNINATFYTPEELFLNIKNKISTNFPFDPKDLNKNLENTNKLHYFIEKNKNEKLSEEKMNNAIEKEKKETLLENIEKNPKENYYQMLVILIGPPGCGKTFLCKNYFSDFIKINLSELKTKKKCLEVLKESIIQGKSVIMDNGNRSVNDRAIYINEAKKINKNIKIEAIYFNYPKDLVFHLNTFKLITDKSNEIIDIPTIAIHSFYKYIEEPSPKENFDKITILDEKNFLPSNFENSEQKKLFFLYLN
ncbi:bifunctional polynucleotide phosphatase/kinase, putative [Plasmodium relictum]|uniref:Bifunctional polynucleotide phosphatase/kinase, putative n=1 Tax=Plasmodium relictum TaxID=85471 RepID=A0A1J1HAU7_PLARL|nr:bifunctional polynucleotide phosphatase/kinase, putative [Plasmodium relictum]CRH00727.1 bifunctional polynucleotide phosphatase/kinase, putative [Plasmodium relictum]